MKHIECDFCEEIVEEITSRECAYCGDLICYECQIQADDGIICPECADRFNVETKEEDYDLGI